MFHTEDAQVVLKSGPPPTAAADGGGGSKEGSLTDYAWDGSVVVNMTIQLEEVDDFMLQGKVGYHPRHLVSVPIFTPYFMVIITPQMTSVVDDSHPTLLEGYAAVIFNVDQSSTSSQTPTVSNVTGEVRLKFTSGPISLSGKEGRYRSIHVIFW